MEKFLCFKAKATPINRHVVAYKEKEFLYEI